MLCTYLLGNKLNTNMYLYQPIYRLMQMQLFSIQTLTLLNFELKDWFSSGYISLGWPLKRRGRSSMLGSSSVEMPIALAICQLHYLITYYIAIVKVLFMFGARASWPSNFKWRPSPLPRNKRFLLKFLSRQNASKIAIFL